MWPVWGCFGMTGREGAGCGGVSDYQGWPAASQQCLVGFGVRVRVSSSQGAASSLTIEPRDHNWHKHAWHNKCTIVSNTLQITITITATLETILSGQAPTRLTQLASHKNSHATETATLSITEINPVCSHTVLCNPLYSFFEDWASLVKTLLKYLCDTQWVYDETLFIELLDHQGRFSKFLDLIKSIRADKMTLHTPI